MPLENRKNPILGVCRNLVNIHLGLSPYYNGTSTNFWPIYNGECEYVGVTVHYIDSGIDTGAILGQTRARIVQGDNPHTIGNKTILAGIRLVQEILPHLVDHHIPGVRQWEAPGRPIYRMKDFTSEIEREFIYRVRAGAIDKWVETHTPQDFQMVQFSPLGPRLVNSWQMSPVDIVVPGART